MANCVVVVCSDAVLCTTLANAIARSDPAADAIVLQLSNKYYSADVRFVTASPFFEELLPLLPECQAVILAYNRFDEASYTLATKAWEQANGEQDIVLCVQVHGQDAPQGKSVDAESAEDWAIENGAEFVEVNLNRDDTTDEVDDDGCKMGLARIREALEVCMWPEMVVGGGASGSGASKAEGLAGMMAGATEWEREGYVAFPEDAAEEPGVRAEESSRPPAAECTAPKVEEEAKAEAEAKVETKAETETKTEEPKKLVSHDEAVRQLMQQAGEEPGIDHDELENMFSEMARVRQESANLPDDSRRRKAADVAMRLMAAFGGSDDSEDEDEDEDEDEAEAERESKEAAKPSSQAFVCALCGNKSSQKCSGCKVVYYCSQKCQKSHWKTHKKECKAATKKA